MKKVIILVLLLAVVGGGYYWYNTYQQPLNAASPLSGAIVGSGSIEAETTLVAAETAGRVTTVYVTEGAEVTAGQLLVELDPSLIQAQYTELYAAIETAKANLVAVKEGAQPEEIAVAQAELSQAQAQAESAKMVWQEMLKLVEDPQELMVPIKEMQSQIKQAEGQIELAQVAVKEAAIQEEAASRNQSSHAALVTYEITQKQHQAAELSIELSEAQLQMLKVQLAHLWEQYTNPVTLQAQANQAEAGYHIAEAAVSLAEANLAVAKAEPMAEEIAVAEAQVALAESSLGLLNVQLDQLAVAAPADGLITTRTADPGELAVPGGTLLKLATLDHVTLRVFIPETQIGRVKLGQKATVTIDSVSQPFEGTVTYIAQEAEFTPKNVQTQEERVNLVFAVEIGLDNLQHILKPGMPADAEILP